METRTCQKCNNDFTVEHEDFDFYTKMQVPPPTFCPMCRAQRRFGWRNERTLYKRTCDYSGKEIFSMYAPEFPGKVYEKEIWLSDDWDALEYGREYDFNRNFFEQFQELLHTVPQKNLNVVSGSNSPYANHTTDPKNCYLVFNAGYCEDTLYGNGLNSVKNSVDISHSKDSEFCYDCFWVSKCSRCVGCSNCNDCFDVWFSKNCAGCNNCIGCVGLRKQSYCIFNKQYTREEYEQKKSEFQLDTYIGFQEMKSVAQDFWLQFPNKFLEGTHNENVSGSYIDHSKNVRSCHLVRNSENLKYCQYVQEGRSTDCYDYSVWGDNSELMYETFSSGIGAQQIKFSVYAQENVHDLEYCYSCSGSAYLFGCVGLKKKQYCIFNTQYTELEYQNLTARIRQQMMDVPYQSVQGHRYTYGEFFPPELSPFYYNQTMGQEYFPMTQEQAEGMGYPWRSPETKDYVPTLLPSDMPDHYSDNTQVRGQTLQCLHNGNTEAQCTKAFRVVEDELLFYDQMKLPVPRQCPACRTYERLQQRLKLQTYERLCNCAGVQDDGGRYCNIQPHNHGSVHCQTKFTTAYDPASPEIVYCEHCYQQETM